MTRAEIKEFIQSGAEYFNLPFDTGRVSEFNSARSNTYPYIFLESPNVTTILNRSIPTDSWTIRIHVAMKDAMDSKTSEYEALIDQADLQAQKLIKQYNDILTNFNLVTITGISRVQFIKQHADCLTGVILQFTLTSQDVTGCG